MTHFRDLEPSHYLSAPECFRSVGWLEPDNPYPTGCIEPDVLEKLRKLFANPFGPGSGLGFHICGWCAPDPGLPPDLQALGESGAIGKENACIPGEECIYISPELILHYITNHGYLPPAEFREAVRRCPPMRSQKYFDELRRLGPSEVAREIAYAEPLLGVLLRAPEEIVFDGKHLLLDAEFERYSSAPGFGGLLRVWERDHLQIPGPWNIQKAWVVRGDEAESMFPGGELEPHAPHEIRRIVESDRDWAGSEVQVIVRVEGRMKHSGLPQLLRAPDQQIP